MIILGLNAFHGDSSACILQDGKLIAAAEEERFTRIKHWAGLPVNAIKFCLNELRISIQDVDFIAINRDPKANLGKKAKFTLTKVPSFSMVSDRIKNSFSVKDIKTQIEEAFGVSIKAQIQNVEHHIAHLASTYFVSPFKDSAVVSVDGFGDFVGTMTGIGKDNKIIAHKRGFFPHSLGLFYLAFTQYMGFPKYGDEYKVMGLAAYGKPRYMEEMRKVVRTSPDSDEYFELDLDYFVHHSKGAAMTWNNGEPKIENVFSQKLIDLFGPVRQKDEELSQKHKDIAASMQKRYEEVLFSILNRVHKETKMDKLAFAGGCAMNSLANGKIFDNTNFKKVYIQPAAGDGGGAIGAAFYVWNHILGKERTFVLERPYLGPEYSNEEIGKLLQERKEELREPEFSIKKIDDIQILCKMTAEEVAKGNVIGWFQGRMEWGPRALGNRSIIGDPRRTDMKDILNLKIKRRESFRPFAPSLHIEAVSDYFECSYPDPFMLKVYMIKPEKRKEIPAVTHADGTGRLQTVRKEDNERYWTLIDEFKKISGTPVVLNTSFNENEPICCKPEEALNCFLRTKMDVLVLNDYFVKRNS